MVCFECNTIRCSEFKPDGLRYKMKDYMRNDGGLLSLPIMGVPVFHHNSERYEPPPEWIEQLASDNPDLRPERQGARSEPMDNDVYPSKVWIKNPAYEIWYKHITSFVMNSSAARFGVRGALDMLRSLHSGRLTMVSQVECHQRWYEM